MPAPDELRDLENKPGVEYDETKTKILFAEDWALLKNWLGYIVGLFSGKQDVLGYTAENSANKKTSLAENSDIYYPSQKAVKTAIDNIQSGDVYVLKTSDETINESEVLQDDNDLYFSVSANKMYAFKLVLHFNSGTVPDFNCAFSVPSGASFVGKMFEDVSRVWQITASGHNCTGIGSNKTIIIQGTFIVGANSGTVKFQWAQDSEDSANTTVLQGSFLSYKLLN
jgi:hypothetical protein